MQSYQVFVNDHLILLTERRNELGTTRSINTSDFESFMSVREVVAAEIELIVNWLLIEEEATVLVQLFGSDLVELMELFKNQFQYIEAAGGLVFNQENDLLMIYRLNKWDLPKGKIEKGESPAEAAVREVEEECGINNLSISKEIPSTFHIYRLKEKVVLKRTYWYEMKYNLNERLVPQTEESIEKVEWVTSDKIEEKVANTYASLKPLLKF